MADMKAAKEVVTGQLEKLKKSIERENSYLKEMEDDKAALTYVEQLMESGESIPENNPYESYTEWKEAIEKEIKAGEASLKRIDTEKAEIIAFEYFLANAPDEQA